MCTAVPPLVCIHPVSTTFHLPTFSYHQKKHHSISSIASLSELWSDLTNLNQSIYAPLNRGSFSYGYLLDSQTLII